MTASPGTINLLGKVVEAALSLQEVECYAGANLWDCVRFAVP